MRLTSANANKLIRKLNEKKAYLVNKESNNMSYVCADGETPVIPEYDYDATRDAITAIDTKIVKIKHAINAVNVTETISVGGESLTIDMVLIKMAQLNQLKSKFESMRRMDAKSRINSRGFGGGSTLIEYKYANFDVSKADADYERVDAMITEMQLALDKFNQTFEFEVDIEL